MPKTEPIKAEIIPGFGKRLQEIINVKYGGVPIRLAKALGRGEEAQFRSRVGAWIAGDGGISGAHLLHLAKITGASAHYLLTGNGPIWAAELITRTDAADATRATKSRLDGQLANTISAGLADEGIGADDLAIDSNSLLLHITHVIIAQIKELAPEIDDGRAIFWHATALKRLLHNVAGVSMEGGLVPVDATRKNLQIFRAIMDHADARFDDIGQYALRQTDLLFPGVSLQPYWDRLRAERQHDRFVEIQSLDDILGADESSTPLPPSKYGETHFTRAFSASRRTRPAKASSKNSPTKKKPARRK